MFFDVMGTTDTARCAGTSLYRLRSAMNSVAALHEHGSASAKRTLYGIMDLYCLSMEKGNRKPQPPQSGQTIGTTLRVRFCATTFTVYPQRLCKSHCPNACILTHLRVPHDAFAPKLTVRGVPEPRQGVQVAQPIAGMKICPVPRQLRQRSGQTGGASLGFGFWFSERSSSERPVSIPASLIRIRAPENVAFGGS